MMAGTSTSFFYKPAEKGRNDGADGYGDDDEYLCFFFVFFRVLLYKLPFSAGVVTDYPHKSTAAVPADRFSASQTSPWLFDSRRRKLLELILCTDPFLKLFCFANIDLVATS
mmetsp:Transcript_76760/g.140494  ORF Transcript_76760/g.140494 Transcript_76760/m.140494 type:complete len:112 (+) Transcript_76760:61-396(+)